MTTQYTPILKLALPVQGELSGTWGDVVNDNITSMIEQAIAGRLVINTWSGNSHTLTTANGTTAEARAAMLTLTDSGSQLSAAGTVVCPALNKTYIVKNGAGQIITVKTASGSGIAIPNGKTMLVYCDGTNVLEGVDHVVTLSAGTLTITGLTTFASLKGADATTVTGILDEDNMASNSATKLATQQSIKAYVDAQVDTADTLAEILAIGNTTGSNDIDVDAAQKVQFRDAAIYINSSVDGQLDIVADTEIQIATATVDLNGNLDVSGTALVTGTLDVDGATQLDSTLTVGVNDTGHDVKFFGASSGSYMLWDESADDLILGGAAGLTVAGDLDVDGTTNLDVVDIDGATQIDATLSVGVDDTGYDVKFFGATSGKSLLWDESADSLIVTGTTTLVGTTNLDAVDIDGAVQADGTITVGVDDTGYDVKFFGATTGKSLLWDESADSLIVTGTIDATTVEFDNLSGTGAVNVTNILDEDNMASDSATALATQQSIKAYVDAQVDTADTLAEILAIGNTTGTTDIEVTAAQKVQFRDAAIYINSSADGQLDIVADTEIQIAATTVDINGAINASGEIIAASLDISGDIDVDGTTNLDVVDIDGAVQADGTITVGVDDTGYDVKFFGATAGKSLLWDESADSLIVTGDIKITQAAGGTFLKFDVDGTTDEATVGMDATDLIISIDPTNARANSDFIIKNDGTETFRIAANGVATFAGEITANGGITSSAPMTITTAGNSAQITLISTDADANVGPLIDLTRDSASPAVDDTLGRVRFRGEDANGAVTAYAQIQATIKDVSAGAVDGALAFLTPTAGAMKNRLNLQADELVINESSEDYDFRVESDANANGLMLDASTSTVGVNKAAASVVALSVNATATNSSTYAFEACNSSSNTKFIVRSDGYSGFYKSSNAGGFIHNTDGAITITPDAGGHFVFNEDGVDADFRVESDGNANMLFVDGGGDGVGIGTGVAGDSTLEVRSTGVDGTYVNAIGFQYSGNSSEANTISTSVSSTGGNSGFKFNCSDGGGSSGKTSVLKITRADMVVNDDSNDYDFRVESDADTHALFVDGATGNVLFGGTADRGGKICVGGTTSTARILPQTDNVGYIGQSDFRWQALYAVNGTVQTSDEREKTEIKPTTLGLDFIKDLRPVSYKWIDGEQQDKGKDEREHQGLIAQQVAEAVEKHGIDKNAFGGLDIKKTAKYDDFHGMAYDQLVAPLIKAIQEQQTLIESLTNRIAALEE